MLTDTFVLTLLTFEQHLLQQQHCEETNEAEVAAAQQEHVELHVSFKPLVVFKEEGSVLVVSFSVVFLDGREG